jgi:hypothetical protein
MLIPYNNKEKRKMEVFMIIALAFITIATPLIEIKAYRKFFSSYKTDVAARTRLYRQAFFNNWGLGIVLFAFFYLNDIPLAKIGLVAPSLAPFFDLSLFVKIPILLFAAWYFGWLYFCATVLIHFNQPLKEKITHIMKHVQKVNTPGGLRIH